MTIFISYSSKNRDLVEILATDLEDLGDPVWFDQELTGGHEWWAQILEQIRACEIFIFAITQDAIDSSPCQREFEYALALQKRVVPIQVDEANLKLLPPKLAKLQIADYQQQDKTQVKKLSKTLKNLPSAKPLPNPPPTEPIILAHITREK